MIFKNIRALREDKDLKQRELAEYLGVSQNTYSQYETGIIAFTDQVLIKLADFYGVSVDYLMDRTTVKEPYPATENNHQPRPKGRGLDNNPIRVNNTSGA